MVSPNTPPPPPKPGAPRPPLLPRPHPRTPPRVSPRGPSLASPSPPTAVLHLVLGGTSGASGIGPRPEGSKPLHLMFTNPIRCAARRRVLPTPPGGIPSTLSRATGVRRIATLTHHAAHRRWTGTRSSLWCNVVFHSHWGRGGVHSTPLLIVAISPLPKCSGFPRPPDPPFLRGRHCPVPKRRVNRPGYLGPEHLKQQNKHNTTKQKVFDRACQPCFRPPCSLCPSPPLRGFGPSLVPPGTFPPKPPQHLPTPKTDSYYSTEPPDPTPNSYVYLIYTYLLPRQELRGTGAPRQALKRPQAWGSPALLASLVANAFGDS
eukprot:Hpha_TRINITY_DN5737_c0_g1::TRINITY_DN5737_c0_g1_i1::g.147480::m.147480